MQEIKTTEEYQKKRSGDNRRRNRKLFRLFRKNTEMFN